MARLIYLLIIFIPLSVSAKQPPWEGIYFGINLGGANIDINPQTSTVFMNPGYFFVTSVPVVNEAGDQHANDRNFTTGVQLGYNWQWDWFVLGLEWDGSYMPSSQEISSSGVYPSTNPPNTFTIDSTTETEWQTTLRPRFGYATTTGPMFYITGGLAVSNVTSEFHFLDHFVHSSGELTDTPIGWAAGGGFEVLISQNSIFRLEYLFTEYTSDEVTNDGVAKNPAKSFLSSSAINPLTQQVSYKVHMLRLGLNLK